MYEVTQRFYQLLVPQAREITKCATEYRNLDWAKVVNNVIAKVLSRSEYMWIKQGGSAIEDTKPAHVRM